MTMTSRATRPETSKAMARYTICPLQTMGGPGGNTGAWKRLVADMEVAHLLCKGPQRPGFYTE